MLFDIYAGLSGGFGGATLVDNAKEFGSEEEAEMYAYELAKEVYEDFEGNNGLRSIDDIMDENDCSLEDALDEYTEEMEGWLDYYAKPSEFREDETER